MSLTVVMAVFVLGCDLLIYVLLKRIYGENPRRRSRRVASKKNALRARQVIPAWVRSHLKA
jgi:hypothetical protein